MALFLFVVTLFWFIHISDRIFFWMYLWQLKEYRFDRMKAHFEMPTGKWLFSNYLYFLKLTLFASSALFFFDFWKTLFVPLGGLFYFALGSYALWKFWTRTISFPVFTKKAILLLILVFLFTLGVFVIKPFMPSHVFISVLLGGDVLVPFIVASVIALIKPISIMLKKRIVQRATSLRSSLPNLLVIGVTGSYGKTTTKEYIAHILSSKFKTFKTHLHVNTDVGIAQILLSDLTREHEICVAEMGAYRRGEIRETCAILQPHIGILTGINEQHISLFGSQENIIKAKYELIEALPPHGLAIFNGDNRYCAILYHKTKKPKRMYATNKSEDFIHYAARNIKAKEGVLSWTVVFKHQESEESYHAKLLGAHNVSNLLAAVAVAKELEMSKEEIQNALDTIQPFPHTMELKEGINGLKIIDDTYSANPDGVYAALDALTIFSKRKIIVMPSLIELGPTALKIHEEIARKIAETCMLAIITAKDYFRAMQKIALENGMTEIDFVYMDDPLKILDKIKSTTQPGDVVLLESRVPQRLMRLFIPHD